LLPGFDTRGCVDSQLLVYFFKHIAVIAQFYRALALYYLDKTFESDKAIQFLEKALSLAKSAEDTNQEAWILISLANVRWRLGQYTRGQSLATEGQKVAKLSGNLYEEAKGLWIEAGCCADLGDYKKGVLLLHRGRELLALCGMAGGNLDNTMMNNEADVYLVKSEYAEARKIQTQIAQKTSIDQDMLNHAYALSSIGEIDVMIGTDEQNIRQNLDKAKTLFDSVQYMQGVFHCEKVFADLNLRKGDTMTAKIAFEKCFHWSWRKTADIPTYCLQRMGDVTRWNAADFDWSSQWAVIYLAFVQISQERLGLYKALFCLGTVFMTLGDKVTAESLFTVALGGFTTMGVHHSMANCLLKLGDMAKNLGDLDRAKALWIEAHSCFERSSQPEGMTQINNRLANP
jgi:tetratricopeptide (TPR) repeat protein